ncbi:MAG TPA: TolC family protein [Chitinophagaceae bacterium]|nr:TolC family protein [Chitinophagaceae bacterium]
MKRFRSTGLLFIAQFFFFNGQLFAQDTLLTAEDAVKYAIEHNYGITISRNNIEIGKINNNWANAGAIPIISATANKAIGLNNLQQKLSNGTVTNRNGTSTKNFNAGVAVNWRVFDGLRMFATKRRLKELERNGEYTFRKNLNEIVYNVISSYYNVVTLKEQVKSTQEQIGLYRDRNDLAQRRFEIGTGAKYEVLEAQVDLNEQNSILLSLQNSLAIAKTSLYNIMGKAPDTTYSVVDTITVKELPAIEEAQNKIEMQNPDILLANSDLTVLFESRKELNAQRLPVVTLNGFYNFARNSNGAGFTLFNQTYGPSGSIGVAIPLFNGGLIKKQVAVTDILIKNQNITLAETKNTLQTALTNAYINYNNSLKIVQLEKSNLELATENIFIATERFKKLNITSVELRQIQISYNDAKTRLYNALYQAKLAEAQVALLIGDITNL